MAKVTYPRTIKEAGLSAKLYRYDREKHGAQYVEYVLAYSEAGKRRMRSFADADVAEEEARKTLRDLSKGIVAGSDMSVSQRQDYGLAEKHVAALKLPVSTVCAEYVRAVEMLAGKASVLEAVNFYLTRANPDLPRRTVAEVKEELVTHKRDVDRVSARDLNDIKERAGHFAAKFAERAISSIAAVEINNYVSGIPGSKRTRYNYRVAVVRLFNFAKSKGYLARDRATEAELSDKVKDGTKVGKIEIYSPDELRAVLVRQDARTLPFVVLNCFSGLRHAEICRLRWRDIWWEKESIHVQGENAKVGEERFVPLLPTLRAWLEKYRTHAEKKPEGLIIGDVKRIQNMASRLNRQPLTMDGKQVAPVVAWKKNGFRHSYISYRLASTQNRAAVAEEAGNSVAMIRKHYRRPILPNEAEAYWSLTPERCSVEDFAARPTLPKTMAPRVAVMRAQAVA